MNKVVLGISGSSGIIYAEKLLEHLIELGIETSVVLSNTAPLVINNEYPNGLLAHMINNQNKTNPVNLYYNNQIDAPIASGSYYFSHMLIVPCSMGCLGRIAHGLSTGLLERVADVALKEKRKLLIVPRETPLHTIHLQNMLALSQLGVTILPPSPAFYHHPQSIADLVNFIVERILSNIGLLSSDKKTIEWNNAHSANC